MGTVVAALAQLPRLGSFVVVGWVLAGALGGAAGLVIGLRVHPATAWFAIFELGIPAAVAGALLGLLVGLSAGRIYDLRTR